MNLLISLFHVPWEQPKFYTALNWCITVGCSDFSLAIHVQLSQCILTGVSRYFPLMHAGLCKWHGANLCSDVLWEMDRQSWNHHHVMMMLTVLNSGSMIIHQNFTWLGKFSSLVPSACRLDVYFLYCKDPLGLLFLADLFFCHGRGLGTCTCGTYGFGT